MPVQGALEDVSSVAFSLPAADAIHPNLVKLSDGFAVVQLKEKTEATRQAYQEVQEEYLRRLRLAKELEALQNYVRGLRDAAGDAIQIDSAVVSDEGSGDADS